MPIKDLPPDARPREKLLARGPCALSDAELLAILLRTGIKGKGVLQMADELLRLKKDSNTGSMDGGFDGISGLLPLLEPIETPPSLQHFLQRTCTAHRHP